MVIVLSNNYVNVGEVKIIKKFCKFVLDKFVKRAVQNKAIITVRILSPEDLSDVEGADLKKYRAWCTYDGVIDDNGRKKFNITINAKCINKKAKTSKVKFRNLMYDLGHELIHCEQYLNGKLKDYVDGSYAFLGKRYSPIPNDDFSEEYYFSPAEIEAFGMELGLYSVFWMRVKRGVISL